jgi:hypothetical protein
MSNVFTSLGCPHLIEPVIWTEFLKYRWSASAAVPFGELNPIVYAQKTSMFGPDLGAIPKCLKPRGSAQPSLQQSPASPGQPDTKGSLYRYFLMKRYQELRGQAASLNIKEMTPKIAKEWWALTDDQKAQLAAERSRETWLQ